MRSVLLTWTAVIGLLTNTISAKGFEKRLTDKVDLQIRTPTGNFNQLYLASNYQNGSMAPSTVANDNSGQTVVVGGTGADDDSQRPGCETIFITTANVNGSQDNGWQEIPNVVGFYVDRNLTYGTSTMPLFVESTKDFSQIKRVLITQPGKPRDSWKYANLFRNSLNCAVANTSMSVEFEDVLIAAPIWLTERDHDAGAGASTDLYFGNTGWDQGNKAQGPGNTDTSTFKVLDDLVDRFANQKEFPSLTSIIVSGHSLGGSIAQRYAMLRNDDSQTDPLVSYWVGNPGSYVWPTSTRPIIPSDTSCINTVDQWAYGVAGDLPAYVRGTPNPDAIYSRYRTRTMQYALGLDDNGAGDTHCEAQYQGSSHLTRGENMQKALEGMQGGMPATQSFNYVPNTSHQDYLMMSDPTSQEFLFVTNLTNTRSSGTQSSSSKGGSKSSGLGKGNGSNRLTTNDNVVQSVVFSILSFTLFMILI